MNKSYLDYLEEALKVSEELKVPNLKITNCELSYQSEEEARNILNLVNGELFDSIENNFANLPYWGNSCLDLTAFCFMFLQARGYQAEMIFGNININSSPDDEFDTTKEYIIKEYNDFNYQREQDIHAWIGLGGNIIIDYAIMDRLRKNYKYPPNLGSVVCGPSSYLEEVLKLKYIPMIVGSDFFKKTNSYDPIAGIEKFKSAI